MKKIKSILLVLCIAFLPTIISVAQVPPPPPPGDDPATTGGVPVGGSAPIGEGIGILLILAGAYSLKRRKTEE